MMEVLVVSAWVVTGWFTFGLLNILLTFVYSKLKYNLWNLPLKDGPLLIILLVAGPVGTLLALGAFFA